MPKIKVTEYLGCDHTSEFSDWEMELGEEYLSSPAAEELCYRLNEVRFDMEVDTDTGEYKILRVKHGNQVLEPVDG